MLRRGDDQKRYTSEYRGYQQFPADLYRVESNQENSLLPEREVEAKRLVCVSVCVGEILYVLPVAKTPRIHRRNALCLITITS